MKRSILYIFIFVLFSNLSASAQVDTDDLKKRYEDFKKNAQQEYSDFRDQANKEYADFVRKAWEEFYANPPIIKPKDDTIPPVVIDEEDKDKPLEDKPVVIEELIDIPEPTPQPEPIAPIDPTPPVKPVEPIEPIDPVKPITPKVIPVTFSLYGTEFEVYTTDDMKFKISPLDWEGVAIAWETLSESKYDRIIRECLDLRSERQLCDWSYLRMLDKFCSDFFGAGTNEAELLKAYIFAQSGYQMRLAMAENHLIMLYGSQHAIFNKGYWTINGLYYFSDSGDYEKLNICQASFPNEQALSLYVTEEQRLSIKPSKVRNFRSSDLSWLEASVSTDENLIAFCNDYPSSYVGENIMTRWAIYANTPLSTHAKNRLYPSLRSLIRNRSTAEAVDLLCHWVQTAFVYEYDDKVWGGDRAFFADETLYYPYCDCEDRSILLTRIVRDLLGLKCVLVYYPGHLATAIAVGDNVKGDYILINNEKFIICDPTYIGAPIGMTMPGMENSTVKVIVLD